MTEAAERLKLQLAALPEQDRAALAHYLIESLDAEEDTDWESAWEAELSGRMEEIDSGQEIGEDGDEVLKRLREKYS